MRDPITSPRNPRIASAIGLARASERKELGRTIVEGPNVLGAAVRGGAAIVEVFATPEDRTPFDLGIETLTTPVSAPVLKAVAGTDNPRGPVAVIEIPAPGSPSRRDTVVLHQLADPGNAGTLLRTAGAFGLQVATTPGTVDVWSPKTLRAAAGAHWATTLTAVDDPVAPFLELDMQVVCTVVEGGLPPDEALGGSDPIALVIGSEAHGLADDIVDRCHRLLTIATGDTTDSLNAAVAGSIALYELAQVRRSR